MSSTGGRYTTQLGAGLGMVDETKTLLGLWSPGMTATELYALALASGRFPHVTARRLRNIVTECFAPRYLADNGVPAGCLKALAPVTTTAELRQLMFVFTGRAQRIFGDFVREVYWPAYEGGHTHLFHDDAMSFVKRAIDEGKTVTRWSDTLVRRVSGYLGVLRRFRID